MKDGLQGYVTTDGRLCLTASTTDAVQALDNLAVWGFGVWGCRTDDDSETPVFILHDAPVYGPRITVAVSA